MPIWIVSTIVLALLLFLSYKKLSGAFLLHLALTVFTLQTDIWDKHPSVEAPHLISSPIVQLVMALFILIFGLTRLKLVIQRNFRIITGLSLLGISLYWVAGPIIVSLGAYTHTFITLVLIVGIPSLGAAMLNTRKQRGEK